MLQPYAKREPDIHAACLDLRLRGKRAHPVSRFLAQSAAAPPFVPSAVMYQDDEIAVSWAFYSAQIQRDRAVQLEPRDRDRERGRGHGVMMASVCACRHAPVQM